MEKRVSTATMGRLKVEFTGKMTTLDKRIQKWDTRRKGKGSARSKGKLTPRMPKPRTVELEPSHALSTKAAGINL